MSQQNSFIFGRRSTAQLTFLAGIGLVVVFSLIPAVGIVVISFTDIRSLPYLPTHWVGIENYRTFFSSAQIAPRGGPRRRCPGRRGRSPRSSR